MSRQSHRGDDFSAIDESSTNCFADDDDELVVAPSSDHRLFIWSVTEGRGAINQSLITLCGHLEMINTGR